MISKTLNSIIRLSSSLEFLLRKIKKINLEILSQTPIMPFCFRTRNILKGVKNTERYLGIRCLSTNLILKGDKFIKDIKV